MTVDDFISVARKLEIIFLKKENIFMTKRFKISKEYTYQL